VIGLANTNALADLRERRSRKKIKGKEGRRREREEGKGRGGKERGEKRRREGPNPLSNELDPPVSRMQHT